MAAEFSWRIIVLAVVFFLPLHCGFQASLPKSIVLQEAADEDLSTDGMIEPADHDEKEPAPALVGFNHDHFKKYKNTVSYLKNSKLINSYSYQVVLGLAEGAAGQSLDQAFRSLKNNWEHRSTMLLYEDYSGLMLINVNLQRPQISVFTQVGLTPSASAIKSLVGNVEQHFKNKFFSELSVEESMAFYQIPGEFFDPGKTLGYLIETILKKHLHSNLELNLNSDRIIMPDDQSEPDFSEKELRSDEIAYQSEEASFYVFPRRKWTRAKKLLSLLGKDFHRVQPDLQWMGSQAKFIREKAIIPSVIAKGHSGKFNYEDFFSWMHQSTGHDIWAQHVAHDKSSIRRVIGYTFRADVRGPIENDLRKCDREWSEGFTSFKTQFAGWKEGCGIKQTLGFWPSFTRPKDQAKIDSLLAEFEKRHGKPFDLSEQDPLLLVSEAQDLGSVEGLTHSLLTSTLNWYLQNVMNLHAHVSDFNAYKGFISTTRSPVIARGWYKGEAYVYVLLTEGGLKLPKSSTLKIKGRKGEAIDFNSYDEQEVAIIGGVDWDDVMAYAKVKDQQYTGEIFMRNGFEEMDPLAAQKVVIALSGGDLY